MKYCIYCGQSLEDNMNFCLNCGNPTDVTEAEPAREVLINTAEAKAEEQQLLDTTHRLLRWERRAWIIFGIISVAYVFLIIFWLSMSGELLASGETDEFEILDRVINLLTSIVRVVLFPIMVAKLSTRINSLYLDAEPAFNRCKSVGVLILSGLFCELAFIFALINFISLRSKKDVANRILTRQKADFGRTSL